MLISMTPELVSRLGALSDEELLEIVKRDPSRAIAAFSELVQRYNPDLLAVAGRYGSNADDVTQGVWLKIWENRAGQFHGCNFRAWLFQQLSWRRTDHYRHDQRRRAHPMTAEIEPGKCDRSLERLIIRERGQALEECISQLPDRQQCIVRATLQNMKTGVAAAHCNLTPAQASQAKFYAVESLRDCTTRKGV